MPPDLALTGQMPDLVLIDRSVNPARVVLLELTVPWDSEGSFKAAFDRKFLRYERLTDDINRAGYNTRNWLPGCGQLPEQRCPGFSLFNGRHQRLQEPPWVSSQISFGRVIPDLAGQKEPGVNYIHK